MIAVTVGRSSKDEQKKALLAALGAPDQPPPPRRRIVVVVIGAVAALAGIAFALLAPRGPKGPAPEHAVEVHVQRVSSLRDFSRLSDASAKISTPAPVELAFEFSGRLGRVADKGTSVKAGDLIASLDDAKALEKELARAREKQSFYEEELASARAGAHPSYVERAERKLADKKKRADAIAASLAGTQIVSPRAGTITAVMLKSGSTVKAKAVVLALQPTEKIAELKVPEAQARQLVTNQMLDLRSEGGARGSGRVLSSSQGTVLVEIQPEGSQLKLGDRVRFVQDKVAEAADVPITAVQTDKATGRERIFLVDGGRAVALPVGVLERRADHATVTGLKGGEQVIVDPPAGLVPGALVRATMPTHTATPASATPASATPASSPAAPTSLAK